MKPKTTLAIAPVVLFFLALIPRDGEKATGQEKSKPDSAAAAELEKLQGVWTFVSREQGGKNVGEEDKNFFLIIRDDVGTLKLGSEVGQVCQIKILDPSANPKKMDLVITKGKNKGETVFCIYEIKGDLFRYCGRIDDSAGRPTSFVTKEGDDKTYCITYRRAKPE